MYDLTFYLPIWSIVVGGLFIGIMFAIGLGIGEFLLIIF